MSELQDMLRVQARLHRKQGANALGDLFDNASKEIEQLEQRCAELEKENKRESMELRSRLGSALGRNSEMVKQQAKANERVKELDEIADTAFKYNHSSAECLRAWTKLQQLRKEQDK